MTIDDDDGGDDEDEIPRLMLSLTALVLLQVAVSPPLAKHHRPCLVPLCHPLFLQYSSQRNFSEWI